MTGLVGLVLCGGHSLRMGQDKGLLREKNGVTWAGRALGLLREQGLEAIVSVRKAQLSSYEAALGPEKFVLDRDLEGGGPLSGFTAAHAMRPNSDLLVLACDMPGLDRGLLEGLLARYDRLSPSERALHVIAFDAEPPEPLCAIYGGLVLNRLHAYKAPKGILFGEKLLRIPLPQGQKLKSRNDSVDL